MSIKCRIDGKDLPVHPLKERYTGLQDENDLYPVNHNYLSLS